MKQKMTKQLLPGNQQYLRKRNRQRIINLIREQNPIARIELSKKTGLNPSTVTHIVNSLLKERLVIEKNLGSSRKGRRPVLLEFNSKAFNVIGVDFGITKIITALLDPNAKILARVDKPIETRLDGSEAIQLMIDTVKKVADENELGLQEVKGIGLAIPGLVDTRAGISLDPMHYNWKNLPIKSMIEKEFGLPVIVDNDGNAMALGEFWFGIKQEVKNLICINVGGGVGSGIVINGEVYRGFTESAGEIGHSTVQRNGPKCACGNYGCLEALTSGPAIARQTVEAIEKGARTIIKDLVKGRLKKITAKLVYEAAKRGDQLAIDILEGAGEYLGIGIANVIDHFDPEMIIISGGVAQAGDLILEPARKVAKEKVWDLPAKRVQIVPSALGKEAGVIGAATLILKEVFNPKEDYIHGLRLAL